MATVVGKINYWKQLPSSASQLFFRRCCRQRSNVTLFLCSRRDYSGQDGNSSYFSRAKSVLGSSGDKGDDGRSLHKVYSEQRLMGYSMEQMFDVVMDIGAYQEFLPWCQSSVILSQRPGQVLASLSIGIPPLTEKYTSAVSFERPFQIHAEATQGRLFSHLINHWEFHPGLKSHPGSSCVVSFSVSFEFKSAITMKLGNVFFDDTAKAMTSAFYDEAKKRYGKESVPSVKVHIIPKKKGS